MKLFSASLAFMVMTIHTQAQHKAERIERTASFVVNASIEKAFPLFGPVREKEWAAGWEPRIVFSNHPEVEQHMIFKTSPRYADESDYLWIVTQYEPQHHFIEYTVSTSQRVWFISVKCQSEDKNTRVTVTYTYTGLTPEGNKMNQQALDRMYANNLNDWAEAVNHYLATGKRLE